MHGSVTGGKRTWSEQRPLASRWTLLVVDRPGFGRSADVDRVDFDVDARLIADLVDRPTHLVGHSYGGVIALLAAARRPEAVRSLTVIEPPAFAVAAGYPEVDRVVTAMKEHWARGPREPEAFLRRFLELVGSDFRAPSPLPAELERGARVLRDERGPWEAEIPLRDLATAAFPALVVSGGHHPAFDAVCDVLGARLGAERAVIPGRGHSVQRAGTTFNDRLEGFLLRAER